MRTREVLTAAAVIAVVTVIGISWETIAVNAFAQRGGGLRGMIASPRPLDYINYDYTPQGRHYAFWAFTVPVLVTSALLFLAGVIGSVRLKKSGATTGALIRLWVAVVFCGAIFFAVTAYFYLIATNFFI